MPPRKRLGAFGVRVAHRGDGGLTRLARYRYFQPAVQRKGDWSSDASIEGIVDVKPGDVPADTDVYALAVDHVVSVTPLDLDMTARVDFAELDKKLR